MRICILADALAEHTRRWAKYFANKGHRVDVVTLNPKTLPGYEPVTVHVIRKPTGGRSVFHRLLGVPAVVWRTKALLRDVRPDVLHAHSAGGYAWLGMLTGFHPFVVTPWGTDLLIDAKRSRWNRRITARALRGADLLTCDAHHMMKAMQALGASYDRMRLVIFGVDLRRFSRKQPGDSSWMKAHGLGGGPVVVSTRTLTPIHDVGTFVRSIPAVHASHPAAKFVIVADGSERPQIESLVDAFGIRPLVHFTGYLDEDEMAAWLRVSDVYVSTSLADAGLAGSTAEAMAVGLPVVVTDNGDNAEWVEESRGGFLIPNGDAEAVADRVNRLLADPALRNAFGERNRAIIEERNNYATEMDRMETLYLSLVEGRAPGRILST